MSEPGDLTPLLPEEAWQTLRLTGWREATGFPSTTAKCVCAKNLQKAERLVLKIFVICGLDRSTNRSKLERMCVQKKRGMWNESHLTHYASMVYAFHFAFHPGTQKMEWSYLNHTPGPLAWFKAKRGRLFRQPRLEIQI